MTQVHGFDIENIADGLTFEGHVRLVDGDGRVLWLVTATRLNYRQPGLLIAYEGAGAYFWPEGQPMNRFLLVDHGFSLKVAPILSDVLKALSPALPAVQPAALPAPEKPMKK